MKNYMIECIRETLEENGEKLSDKCINDLADSVICYRSCKFNREVKSPEK